MVFAQYADNDATGNPSCYATCCTACCTTCYATCCTACCTTCYTASYTACCTDRAGRYATSGCDTGSHGTALPSGNSALSITGATGAEHGYDAGRYFPSASGQHPSAHFCRRRHTGQLGAYFGNPQRTELVGFYLTLL